MSDKARRWAIGFMLVGMLVAAWTFRPRERSLLDQAVRVTDTTGWELPNGDVDTQDYMTYYWSAAGKVLFFREDDTIEELLCQYDPATGTETRYRKLSARWSQDGFFKKQIAISPDGRWVLWDGDYWNHDYHGFYGSRLDGTHGFHFRTSEESIVYWLNDSRHFIEQVDGGFAAGEWQIQRLLLRSVDTPQNVRQIPLANIKLLDRVCLGVPQLLGTSRILVMEEKPPGQWPAQQYTFYETALGASAKPLRQWTCRVPSPAIMHEIALSPQGDKIAWLIDTEEVPPMLKLLHHLSAWFKPKSVRSARLCISDLDGSHMRRIGRMDVPPPWDGPDFAIYPHELKWLPDGKRVSFIYKDALYTVPVD